MPNRKQYTETIMGSLRLARHALAEQSLPPAKPWLSRRHRPEARPITPSQWALLSLIIENGHMSNQEIADMLCITNGAVTQLADGLVKKKYLIRENATTDRRRLSLKISRKYTQQVCKMKALSLQRVRAIFTDFTDEEMAQYAKLSRKFADSILKMKMRVSQGI
jgi:DNA-binding MarR family transcriptional regulator